MFAIFGFLFGLIGAVVFGAVATAGLAVFAALLLPLLILGLFFRAGFALLRLVAVGALVLILVHLVA